MFGNRFSSSRSCSKWRHETKPGRLDRSRSCRFLKVATHPFLEKSDWKYEGSSASAAAGGRTHTFGVRQRAKKLRGKAVYRRAGIVVRDGKPVPADSEH